MPKFRILARLPFDRIPAAVPPDFRDRVRFVTQPGEIHTVVLFSHDRDKGVVTSAAVRRALARIESGESILAIGTDFTREATELLNARDAAIARIGEFGWTDESYHSLRRRRSI